MQLMAGTGIELQLSQDKVSLSGHAMEARIYAEDPPRDSCRQLSNSQIRYTSWTSVAVDSGVRKGDAEVTTSLIPCWQR